MARAFHLNVLQNMTLSDNQQDFIHQRFKSKHWLLYFNVNIFEPGTTLADEKCGITIRNHVTFFLTDPARLKICLLCQISHQSKSFITLGSIHVCFFPETEKDLMCLS